MYANGVESLVRCTIANISKEGAMLTFRSAHDVPEILDLRLSNTSPLKRRCRVVWRHKDSVGVQFVPSTTTAARPSPALRPEEVTG